MKNLIKGLLIVRRLQQLPHSISSYLVTVKGVVICYKTKITKFFLLLLIFLFPMGKVNDKMQVSNFHLVIVPVVWQEPRTEPQSPTF